MRLFPDFLATAVCAIVSVVSAGEQSYLSNFRAVYHGHGATSYQNVHIENSKSVLLHKHAVVHADAEHLTHADHVALVIPFASENDHEVHLPNKAVYEDIELAQGESSVHGVPEYYTYEHAFDGEHEYEYYR